MKKLLMTRVFPAENIAAARKRFEVTVRDEVTGLSVEAASKALKSYDAILCSLGDGFTDMAFVDQPLRCRVLANFGVGYNHIDVEAARAAGVAVSNTPDVVTDATADIALTLILMACRRAGEGERLVRSGRWDGWNPMQMLGTHVTGKRLGIVGMGRIGQAVATRCHHGFGMPVIYYNRSRKEVDVPSRQVETLEALMSQADIVVVTVPGGEANRHLIDAAALAAADDRTVIVNVARGDVIDEAALIAELQSGRLVAGLDVYEREPVVPETLRALENVVLLPHLGTAALEVRAQMGAMALENIFAWDEGRDLPNRL